MTALVFVETGGHPNNFSPGNLSAAGFVGGVEVSHWAGEAWRPPWFAPSPDASPLNLSRHDLMVGGGKTGLPSAFRAYPAIDGPGGGLVDFMSLLAHHYPRMTQAAAVGDLRAFALAYRDEGYCPDCDPHTAELAFASRRAQLRVAHAFDGIPVAPPVGPGGVSAGAGVAVLAAAAVTAAVILWLSQRPL